MYPYKVQAGSVRRNGKKNLQLDICETYLSNKSQKVFIVLLVIEN